MQKKTRRTLRRLLAKLYPSELDIRRIIHDADIDQTQVIFGSSALNVWDSILTLAESVNHVGSESKLDNLLNIINEKEEYGSNPDFLRLYAEYKSQQLTTPAHPSTDTQKIDTPNSKNKNSVDRAIETFLDNTDQAVFFWMKKPFYRLAKLIIILSIIAIIAIASVQAIVSSKYPPLPQCADGNICIVTASLSSIKLNLSDNETYNIQKSIEQAFSLFETSEKPVIQTLPEGIEVTEDTVSKIAAQTSASLVVWGHLVSKTQVRLNLYSDENFSIAQPSKVRSFRIQPIYNNSIKLKSNCLIEICILLGEPRNAENYQDIQRLHAAIYAAVGLAYYQQEHFPKAENLFQYALYCLDGYVFDDAKVAKTVCRKDQLLKLPSKTETRRANYHNQTTSYKDVPRQFYIQCNNDELHLLESQVDSWDLHLRYLIYYFYGKSLVRQGSYAAGISKLIEAIQLVPLEPANMISISDAYQQWLKPTTVETGQIVMDPLHCAEVLLHRLEPNASIDKYLIYYNLGIINEQSAALNSEIKLSDAYKAKLSDAKAKYLEAYENLEYYPKILNPYVVLMALGRITQATAKADTPGLNYAMIQEAANYFKQAAQQTQSYEVYLELAKVYQSLGDDQVASSYLQQAQGLTSFAEYRELATLEFCQNSSKGGNCTCPFLPTQVNENIPNASWINDTFGDCFRKQREWAVAAEYFIRSTELRAYDPWAHERLGYTLQQLGQYESALEHYQLALELVHPIYTSANQLERLYRQKKFILCQNHIIPSGQLWFTPVCY